MKTSVMTLAAMDWLPKNLANLHVTFPTAPGIQEKPVYKNFTYEDREIHKRGFLLTTRAHSVGIKKGVKLPGVSESVFRNETKR